MIEDVSGKDMYEKRLYSGFKSFDCDLCKNPISAGDEHIIESWHGETIMVVSRRFHKSCEQYIGRDILDIDL